MYCSGARERGALGLHKAPGRGGLELTGSRGTPAEAWRARKGFLHYFPESSSSSDLARKAGLFAVLDEADIEFSCTIQKYSEAIVLSGGGRLVQNLMRGLDTTQLAYLRV